MFSKDLLNIKSIFTKSFALMFIKLVNSSVLGITTIWNPSFVIFAIVKETPLILIEPL